MDLCLSDRFLAFAGFPFAGFTSAVPSPQVALPAVLARLVPLLISHLPTELSAVAASTHSVPKDVLDNLVNLAP